MEACPGPTRPTAPREFAVAVRLATTCTLGDDEVEIYERTGLVYNPAISAASQAVLETIYVLPAPDWPKVRVRGRRGFGRLFFLLGRRPGIRLENTSFFARYRVECEDEEFAILVLNPELQRFILEKTTVDWSVGGGAIKLFYRGRLRPKRIDRSLARLGRFRDLIDPELFTLYGVER